MDRIYETEGDTWRVYLGEDRPHPDVLPLIFYCTSNSSNGWRVVEVPAGEYAGDDPVAELSDPELEDLFDRAQPFDFTHDPKSAENSVGDSPLR